jgi:class 3 adenylate cyclase/pimeloyl-ACP methyl ester carboxylesterase
VPQTRYARSGDVQIAYQVLGDGPIDLIWVAGYVTHLDVYWEDPEYRRFCGRLASFSRLILFDKRGMGLSDRVRVATLEERIDDVRAVMDAIGSERAVLMGASEGGPMSILFAASVPERVRALILCGAEVKEDRTDDWPWGEGTWEEFEGWMQGVDESWGSGEHFWQIAPTRNGDESVRRWWGKMETNAMTPGAAVEFMRMGHAIDVRDVLPSVRVPTLVLHRTGDRICHVENGRFEGANIPGAIYVELPGEDHAPWIDGGDDIIAEIAEFLTGTREPGPPERVLATVLFTDLVGSTELARTLGDRRWRELIDRHHGVVRTQLARFRGREIDTAGDGFLAAFDGPARAIRCAEAIMHELRPLELSIRAGVHTGECEVSAGKLVGVAVHIGARVVASAGPDEVFVSRTVTDLVAGSGIRFESRGRHHLKGLGGEYELFSVADLEVPSTS